jgi:hypothetical protein
VHGGEGELAKEWEECGKAAGCEREKGAGQGRNVEPASSKAVEDGFDERC